MSFLFLTPWAWLGLAALALPVIAHLFAQRPARRVPFPTLRFLPASRLTPVRRDRLTDVALLVLRCLVVTAAVAALAQPAWRHAGASDSDGAPARAIVIDSSASMQRESAPGSSAIAAARREAAALAASAAAARVVESDEPAESLAPALAWLGTASGPREVAIVSDFQIGTLDRIDVAGIPPDVGVRLVRVPAQGVLSQATSPAGGPAAVTILAGTAERTGADAARRAAEANGAPAGGRTDRPVAVVFPQYERREALAAAATPLDQPWMFGLVSAIAADRSAYWYAGGLRWQGGVVNGRPGVLLLTDVSASSVAAAALLGAAARAAAGSPPPTERAEAVIADTDLQAWSREPGPRAPSGQPSAPWGRWLWVSVLVLLAIEALWRRTSIAQPVQVSDHERAA